MSVQIQLRRGTAAQWTSANTLLAQGEIGLEYDTGKIKVGDGTLAWNSLAYFTGTGAVTSVTGTSPVVSSGGTTPAISLASGYGDTKNPYASKTANYVLAAPDGTAGVPTFRAIVAADIPTLNQNTTGTAANVTASSNSTLTTLSALSLPGSQVSGNISGNAANVTGTVAVANGGTGAALTTSNFVFAGPTSGSPAAPSFRALTTADIAGLSSGSVTSVALALPSIMTVSGSPVTSTGTLTGTLTTQAVNAIFAGPSSGAAAAPTFRSLTTADIPTLNQNTTGTAANVTGIVAVANGGTGLSSGTSGGVPYYSATGTIASSSALSASALVIGGGAGVAPSTITTGTSVVTALGVNVGSAGAVVVNGGVLGTPSSGTATNLTGLPLTTGVTGILPVANGGSGTATPSLVAGTNVTVTGTWPNQTIAASGGGGGGSSAGSNIFLANNFGGF